MENQTEYDISCLIEFIELATPDSLNIAEAILRVNNEIDIPELQVLREAIYQSLDDKKNDLLSDNVEEIKMRVIASLLQKTEAIREPHEKDNPIVSPILLNRSDSLDALPQLSEPILEDVARTMH